MRAARTLLLATSLAAFAVVATVVAVGDPISLGAFNGTIVLGSPAATSVKANVFSTDQGGSIVLKYGTSPGVYDRQTPPATLSAGTPLVLTLDALAADTRYYYRLYYEATDGTGSGPTEEYTFHTARPPGATFTFTIQADSHLDGNTTLDLYRQTLANVHADAPDFHVDLGDTFMCEKFSEPLSSTSQAARDQATVDARYRYERANVGLVSHSAPLFLVNGNHDAEAGWLARGTADNLAIWATKARQQYFGNPVPDAFYTGDSTEEPYVGKRASWYAWQWGDALFVVLDPYWNAKDQPARDAWNLTLGDRQYAWLADTLASSSATYKFVFVHSLVGGLDGQMRGGIEAAPYFEWGGRELDGTVTFAQRRPGWAMPIHQLLVQHHVTAVFHGHDHLYARQELDGVVYQEVPQPSAKNSQNGPTLASDYHYASGTILSSSGHLRVTVAPSGVTTQYVRAWLPANETAQRKNGQVEDTWAVTANATPPPPTAAFTVSTPSPVTNQTVTFADTSSGSPTAWAWTFGDGTSSSVRSPSKVFATAGTFTVTLVASNASGSSTASRSVTVIAAGSSSTFDGNIVLGTPTGTSVKASVFSPDQSGTLYLAYGTVSGSYATQTAPSALQAATPLQLSIDGLQPDTRYYYRLYFKATGQGSFSATDQYSFHTARSAGSTFTFTVQGDSHPERERLQFNGDLYTRTLLTAAADTPDFHLTLGDDFSVDTLDPATIDAAKVTERYTLQRPYLGLIGRSAPVFLVNGNHEQAARYLLDGTPDNVAVWAQNARNTHYAQPAPDGFYTGNAEQVPYIGLLRNYYAWTWGDALFVVIDPYWASPTAVDAPFGDGAKRTDQWEVTHGDAQYQWLKATLEQSHAKYKFVFAHHVLGTGRGGVELTGRYEWGGQNGNGTWGFDTRRPGWPTPIHQLMAANHVTVFFQGHDHLWARQELDGVTYQTLPEPADPNYTFYNADAYLTGDKLSNTGYARVRVSPSGVTVDYVRTYLPADEGPGKTSGTAALSYSIGALPTTPTAAFSFAPAAPVGNQTVTFTDASTGNPTAWSWHFGDGATSSLQHPAHAFASAGTFTVTLTISNAAGSSTASRTVIVSSAATGPGPAFTMAQTLSDGAQRTTLAFSGLAMMTGNLEAQSFFPPGKVADYTGFQYLRDNDPSNMGHNTSFLTRIANNVLYILNDTQFAQLKTLATAQMAQIDLYGYKRFPLMKAFRRLLDGDVQSGATGLDLDAVKQASRELYVLDGQISFDRAVLYAALIKSLDATQKAYLDAMKGKGWSSWPDISDTQVRSKMQGLPQGTSVAVMTYASDLFSWYAGSVEADVYFCPERQGTYYGGFYIKDAPAIGHEGYSIDEQLTATAGAALSDSSKGYVTPAQAALMSSLVETQRTNLYASPTANIVQTRTEIATLLRSLLTTTGSTDAIRARVLELSGVYGDLDGENNHAYATVFAQVYQTLSAAQKTKLATLRQSIMSGTYADGTPFDFSVCTTPFLYSGVIKDQSVLAPYVSNTDYLFGAGAAPTAAFTFAPAAPAAGQAVAFSDTSTGGPTAWAWTFGDGTTSALQHPSHTYTAAGNYTVALTVSNGTTSNSVSRTITVSPTVPVSHVVTITAGPTGTPNPVVSAAAVSLAATATDTLDHQLSYQWTSACPGAATNGSFSNGTSAAPTWTAPGLAAGASQACTVTVTASDGLGQSATRSFVQNVTAPTTHTLTLAKAPAGSPNPSQAGQVVGLDLVAQDSFQHALAYLWQAVCAEVSGTGTFTPLATSATPTWTPPVNTTGGDLNCLIRVTVIDNADKTAQASFIQKVSASAPSHAITITVPPSGSPNPVASASPASLSVSAADSLGHALTYQWTASCPTLGGSGSFSNPAAQSPTWTSPVNSTAAVQTCTIQVVASDGQGQSGIASYAQTVAAPGQTHTLTFAAGPTGSPNASSAGSPVTFGVTPIDSLGHALTYLWQVTCGETSAAGTFTPAATAAAPTWTPPPNPPDTDLNCLVRVTVIDGVDQSATASFIQRVRSTPTTEHTLVVTQSPGGTPNPVPGGSATAVSVTAADSRGHTLSYRWAATCPAALGSHGAFSPSVNVQAATWTAPANDTGSEQVCTMRVVIDDLQGQAVEASYAQRVSSPLHTVTITAAPTGTPNPVSVLGSATLSVTAADSLKHAVTYAWTSVCAGLSSGGTFAPSAAVQAPSWTPPSNPGGTPFTCTISATATDPQGISASGSYVHTVTTTATGHSLTITSGPAGSPNPVPAGTTAALAVAAIDTQGHTLSYLWQATCAGVPSGGTFSPSATTSSTTWIPPANTTGADIPCLIRVTIIDSAGLSATAAYRHTVVAAPPAVSRLESVPHEAGSANQRYFAEGATTPPFDCQFAFVNPGKTAATVLLQFLKTDGSMLDQTLVVPAFSRRTLDARRVPGLESAAFSTSITSDVPVVADRTMTWDAAAYGAHAETGIAQPSTTWYLAEGSTVGGFNLFYLLQNPNPADALVRVRYLRPQGAPIERTYTLPPTSRTTIWVNQEEVPGLGRILAGTDVSAVIEVINQQAIIVERAMYLDVPGQALGAGHESAGITSPATEWFLAEGATGAFFDLFVLVANPGTDVAQIEATYLLAAGTTITKSYAVPASSRFNIWVDQEDARLADTAVSTAIRSTNGVPVVVERAMWWPGSTWYEAHGSPASTTTGVTWALAEGEVGGARATETYILVANTSEWAGAVDVTLLFEDGTAAARAFAVAANSRLSINVGTAFPASANKRFGAVIDSQGETPAQIVVERAIYWNASGQVWAAGTGAMGTKLR